jgi:hypothetical protein
MGDDLKKIMQPKTIIFLKMEDDLIFFDKDRLSQKKIMQTKTIKSKNNGCGTTPNKLDDNNFYYVIYRIYHQC